MRKSTFLKKLSVLPKVAGETPKENIFTVFGHAPSNSLCYAAICECMFKTYLKDVGKDGTDKGWSWYHDLSVSEWWSIMNQTAVIDTCRHALKYWCDSEECMKVFLLSLAIKSNEHYERGDKGWCEYYANLFDYCRDLVYEYYENDEEKTRIIWEYLD